MPATKKKPTPATKCLLKHRKEGINVERIDWRLYTITLEVLFVGSR